MEETIIAIDPGREKCGIAVVHNKQGSLCQQVIPTISLADTIHKLSAQYNATTIILGDGTAHQQAKSELENIRVQDQPLTIHLIDERHSTDQARHRYWQVNPPKGLRRLIPTGMQVPPVPVDDHVAVILAERYFSTPPTK